MPSFAMLAKMSMWACYVVGKKYVLFVVSFVFGHHFIPLQILPDLVVLKIRNPDSVFLEH